MGKKKRVTNNGLKRQKIIREIVVVASLVVLFWVWMLYTTRPATEENTYRCQGTVTDAVVDEDASRHGSSFEVMVYMDDDCYLVNVSGRERPARGREGAQLLAQDFLAADGEVSLMVWKRPIHIGAIFDYMYYYSVRQLYDLQIVEAKCGDTVLWSLETHNAYQHEQRIAGYISGGIITLLVGGWELMNWKIFYPRRSKKKKKRSDVP